MITKATTIRRNRIIPNRRYNNSSNSTSSTDDAIDHTVNEQSHDYDNTNDNKGVGIVVLKSSSSSTSTSTSISFLLIQNCISIILTILIFGIFWYSNNQQILLVSISSSVSSMPTTTTTIPSTDYQNETTTTVNSSTLDLYTTNIDTTDKNTSIQQPIVHELVLDDSSSVLIQQQNKQQQKEIPPNIVWLLSFPNSGTTYTLKLIQSITNTTTGTNYGGSEQVGYTPSIPLYGNCNSKSNNNTTNSSSIQVKCGPFVRYPNKIIPIQNHQYLLTKTHCHIQDHHSTTGTSSRAGSSSSNNGTSTSTTSTGSTTTNNFIHYCSSGNVMLSNGTIVSTTYNSIIGVPVQVNLQTLDDTTSTSHIASNTTTLITQQQREQDVSLADTDTDTVQIHKIVHLIRNPFDNIVARLHYERKRWKEEIQKQQQQQQQLLEAVKNNVQSDFLFDDANQYNRIVDDKTDNTDNNNDTDEIRYYKNYKNIIQSSYQLKEYDKNLTYEQMILTFTDTKIGFYKWCSYMDRISVRNGYMRYIFSTTIPPTSLSVNNNNNSNNGSSSSNNFKLWYKYLQGNGTLPPCLTEFYRYIQWHQNALQMIHHSDTKTNSIPYYRLYYENYTTSATTTTTTTTTDSNTIDNETTTIRPITTEYPNVTITIPSSSPSDNDDDTSSTNTTTSTTIIQLSKVVVELLQFLNFSLMDDIKSQPIQFVTGKHYASTYYNTNDRYLLSLITKSYFLTSNSNTNAAINTPSEDYTESTLNSNNGWELFQHYFQ